MAVQGFFSPDKKTRMAGEKENNSFFSVKVEPVKVANNINQYNEQTPYKPDAPDRVGEYIRDSETRPSYTQDDKDFQKAISIDTSYGKDFGTYIKNLDSRDFSKDYGVAFSDDEKRVTEAKEGLKGYEGARNIFGEKYTGEVDYKKLESDYAKYQPQRDRREFRKGVEDNLSDFRKSYMTDFARADYAIKMKQYNPDGTEKDINKYNASYDQQIDNLKSLRQYNDPNLTVDRFGNIVSKKEKQKYEQKVAAEEAERTRLSKLKAKSDYEDSQKNIFQKIGDTVGNVFNKLTGTEAAEGSTLQSQGINTGSTVNLSQIGNVSSTVQAARDAVAKANLRRSGLDKTIGGRSSQANYGRASRGFGTGTHGKGMPSNPKGMRQKGVGVSANNLSRHKAGHSSSQPKRGGISKSSGRGQGGKKGGGSSGGGSKGGGGSSSGSKGGAGSGSSKSNTGSKRGSRGARRCDIRCKIDISPLIESNLVKDNLAEVAYFVQEIKK